MPSRFCSESRAALPARIREILGELRLQPLSRECGRVRGKPLVAAGCTSPRRKLSRWADDALLAHLERLQFGQGPQALTCRWLATGFHGRRELQR